MEVKVNNKLQFTGKFEDIEDYNSSFKKVKIKVHALGENRNLSDITDDAFKGAKNSIFNIPIVAKYNDGNDVYGLEGDLESHNSVIKKNKKGEWIFTQDTYPIGVVSSDSDVYYEDINEGTEEEPDVKTYIVVDNVFLWKRYEATQKIEEWLASGIDPKVSMEIGNIEGIFENNTFKISAFEYEAICALGSAVTPCFPMAQIENYSKQTFEDNFYEMIKELKFSLNQSSPSDVYIDSGKGGNKVDEKLELLQKYSITVEQLQEKEIDIEQFSVEDLEEKIKELFSTNEPDNTNTDNNPDNTNFALTAMQLKSEIRAELRKVKVTDSWGYEWSKYWYVDHDDSVVIVEDSDDYKLYGLNYTTENDKVIIDFESAKRKKIVYADFEEGDVESEFTLVSKERVESQFEVEKVKAVEEVQVKFNELNDKYTALETEKTELEQFKNNKLQTERQDAEDELFEKFSTQLTEEEIKTIKDISADFSLEEIESKLFELVGKKTAKFSVKKENKVKIVLPVVDEPDKSGKPYAHLIKKHTGK